ncbi:hypothetical protein PFTANZ_05044 [Plasmodium falciparum Tanzania (2000708)]|uniref:ubiquitinyl hydrolase 1 n=1 Tax=Plasmodium falciparum Tanzania (2000708) TaxID=1036725 RepID=A0A024W0Q7_PLAFA|nr:hypothetical protein PFTANZ_05044 [Plasmodium falciparum Tanzania (2000708)]
MDNMNSMNNTCSINYMNNNYDVYGERDILKNIWNILNESDNIEEMLNILDINAFKYSYDLSNVIRNYLDKNRNVNNNSFINFTNILNELELYFCNGNKKYIIVSLQEAETLRYHVHKRSNIQKIYEAFFRSTVHVNNKEQIKCMYNDKEEDQNVDQYVDQNVDQYVDQYVDQKNHEHFKTSKLCVQDNINNNYKEKENMNIFDIIEEKNNNKKNHISNNNVVDVDIGKNISNDIDTYIKDNMNDDNLLNDPWGLQENIPNINLIGDKSNDSIDNFFSGNMDKINNKNIVEHNNIDKIDNKIEKKENTYNKNILDIMNIKDCGQNMLIACNNININIYNYNFWFTPIEISDKNNLRKYLSRQIQIVYSVCKFFNSDRKFIDAHVNLLLQYLNFNPPKHRFNYFNELYLIRRLMKENQNSGLKNIEKNFYAPKKLQLEILEKKLFEGNGDIYAFKVIQERVRQSLKGKNLTLQKIFEKDLNYICTMEDIRIVFDYLNIRDKNCINILFDVLGRNITLHELCLFLNPVENRRDKKYNRLEKNKRMNGNMLQNDMNYINNNILQTQNIGIQNKGNNNNNNNNNYIDHQHNNLIRDIEKHLKNFRFSLTEHTHMKLVWSGKIAHQRIQHDMTHENNKNEMCSMNNINPSSYNFAKNESHHNNMNNNKNSFSNNNNNNNNNNQYDYVKKSSTNDLISDIFYTFQNKTHNRDEINLLSNTNQQNNINKMSYNEDMFYIYEAENVDPKDRGIMSKNKHKIVCGHYASNKMYDINNNNNNINNNCSNNIYNSINAFPIIEMTDITINSMYTSTSGNDMLNLLFPYPKKYLLLWHEDYSLKNVNECLHIWKPILSSSAHFSNNIFVGHVATVGPQSPPLNKIRAIPKVLVKNVQSKKYSTFFADNSFAIDNSGVFRTLNIHFFNGLEFKNYEEFSFRNFSLSIISKMKKIKSVNEDIFNLWGDENNEIEQDEDDESSSEWEIIAQPF